MSQISEPEQCKIKEHVLDMQKSMYGLSVKSLSKLMQENVPLLFFCCFFYQQPKSEQLVESTSFLSFCCVYGNSKLGPTRQPKYNFY